MVGVAASIGSMLALMALPRCQLLVRRVLAARWHRAYERFEQGAMRSLRRLPLLGAYSALGWPIEGATLWVLGLAIGVRLPATGALVAGLVASLLSVEPITPGGLGVTGPGIVLVLGSIGVAAAGASAIALPNPCVNYLSLVIAAALAVDLIPANLRPWVDSTQDNSAISLALRYNGIDRLLGQRESLTQFLSGLGLKLPSSETPAAGGFPGGFGGMFNNGPAGPFRLFDQELGGQASWLLPLSLVAMAIATWKRITRRTAFGHTRQGQIVIVFGAWLLAASGFFSVADFFHSYYLVTLGPPIAALASIAVIGLWRELRTHTWLGWLLPLAVLGTAVVQARMLADYPTWSAWLTPLVISAAALAAVGLLCGLVGAGDVVRVYHLERPGRGPRAGSRSRGG